MPTPTPNQPTDDCLNGIVNFEFAGISNGQAYFMVETEGYYGTIYHSNKTTFAVDSDGIDNIINTLRVAKEKVAQPTKALSIMDTTTPTYRKEIWRTQPLVVTM